MQLTTQTVIVQCRRYGDVILSRLVLSCHMFGVCHHTRSVPATVCVVHDWRCQHHGAPGKSVGAPVCWRHTGLRPHNSAAHGASLASDARVHPVQVVCTCTPMCRWIYTVLPEKHHLSCRKHWTTASSAFRVFPRSCLPSVLWHCWLGHLTRKNPSLIWHIMCLVGR